MRTISSQKQLLRAHSAASRAASPALERRSTAVTARPSRCSRPSSQPSPQPTLTTRSPLSHAARDTTSPLVGKTQTLLFAGGSASRSSGSARRRWAKQQCCSPPAPLPLLRDEAVAIA
jgi:hypothetical protein